MAGTLILSFFAGMLNLQLQKGKYKFHYSNANYDFTGTGGEIPQTEERGSHQG